MADVNDATRHRGVHAFRLDQQGLARIFGELEAEIMDVLWSLGEGRVSDVCEALGGDVNYKTVMTVMNRLVEKRALRRARASRAYVYRPAEGRHVFLERVSRHVVEGLVRDFGDLAVAQFVDVVDTVDPALLERLRVLIEARAAREDAP